MQSYFVITIMKKFLCVNEMRLNDKQNSMIMN